MDVVLFSNSVIKQRIDELSYDILFNINEDDDVVFLCVLRGSFMFFADLVKDLPPNITIDFIQVSSYGNGTTQGELKINSGEVKDYTGKKVFIVDDIVDSGNTILALKDLYKSAKEVYTITLIARNGSKHLVDFYGFEIGNEWIWGYGMDLNGKSRNIRHIMYKEQNLD